MTDPFHIVSYEVYIKCCRDMRPHPPVILILLVVALMLRIQRIKRKILCVEPLERLY